VARLGFTFALQHKHSRQLAARLMADREGDKSLIELMMSFAIARRRNYNKASDILLEPNVLM
jgi:hypothetical protein